MVRKLRVFGTAVAMVVVGVTIAQAANLTKAIADAEGRKKAAETGLKQIKLKSADVSREPQAAYEEAARWQNAWRDGISGALAAEGGALPDVSGSAQSVATSLVLWVNVRNRALGLPELTEPTAESVKKSVGADLVEIAKQTWKNNAGANAKKRATAAESLNTRLQWRRVDDIQ
jgi:hypothetical protein